MPLPTTPQLDLSQDITKDLYSKNLDLLNANKIFELIQKLYEIMIVGYSIENISQRFIDVIKDTMGFTDGIVVAKDDRNDYLNVVGITQTQINKTLLDLTNTATVDIRFDLKSTGNALTQVFLSGKSVVVSSISQIWTPYIKNDDVAGIGSVLGTQYIFVYPIIFGKTLLGSFALFMGKNGQELTDFEKKALERLVTVFGIAIDRVKINIDLDEAKKRELDKTKELLKIKDEFVFIATHDLKTPVTAISGFVELMEASRESFSQDNKENLEAIKESSDRLNQLTNDLLEVARGDSGTIVIEVSKVDLVGVIADVIQEVTPSAAARNIVISSHLDAVNKFILADKVKIFEVLENLLSNAVKYNRPNGKVDVITVLKNNMLEITVSDTGYGIPQDKQDKIFQKFFRARQKGTEEVPGTGLGLFVVRMLVEKMGGTISFTSKEGSGSAFIVNLSITS